MNKEIDNHQTASLGSFKDYAKSVDSSTRRSTILRMSGDRKKNAAESQILNELVLFESESILQRRGNKYIVEEGKSGRRKMKEGYCYLNSVEMMDKGYGYVEGYVTRKQDGYTFGHAWNVDKKETQYDFTLKDPEKYEYYGVIIPNEIVRLVGERNGYTWYAVLPFLDNEFNYKED